MGEGGFVCMDRFYYKGDDIASNYHGMALGDVEILDFNLAGPVLAVRPYCHTDHYWQVYFDTNRAIREAFGAAGFPVPEQHVALRNGVAAATEPAQQMRLHA